MGLNFCKSFDQVKIQCDDQCVYKKVAVDVLNEAISNNEFPRGLDIPSQEQTRQQLLPIDINTKLRADCKSHIMELFPELFEGIGTMKNVIIKLDVDQSVTPIVELPRKISQAMMEPLKQEIDRRTSLGVIRKLNINEATDWCHNLVLVCKPNGKLQVCLDPRTINKALRFNVHNARTFQNVTSSIRRVAKVSKIDANSGFWTLPIDEDHGSGCGKITPLFFWKTLQHIHRSFTSGKSFQEMLEQHLSQATVITITIEPVPDGCPLHHPKVCANC